ncbi:hypothetical protein DFP72DRAFT_1098163 [Ephemerocybe angulata]|uniref:Uncharacterized protein n=1 Tax=Ephemerocybe angulata TaxID=980116 RepID=A0A8H6HDG7_9AGAR|nr:hypothetical protein DFP72DRAFT_1098163 [Tulosesus angulatus]
MSFPSTKVPVQLGGWGTHDTRIPKSRKIERGLEGFGSGTSNRQTTATVVAEEAYGLDDPAQWKRGAVTYPSSSQFTRVRNTSAYLGKFSHSLPSLVPNPPIRRSLHSRRGLATTSTKVLRYFCKKMESCGREDRDKPSLTCISGGSTNDGEMGDAMEGDWDVLELAVVLDGFNFELQRIRSLREGRTTLCSPVGYWARSFDPPTSRRRRGARPLPRVHLLPQILHGAALVTHTGSTRPLYSSSSQTQRTAPSISTPPSSSLTCLGCDTYSSSSLYSHSRCESQYHSGSGYHSHSCSTNSRSQTANIQVLQAAPCSRLPGTPRTLRFPRLGQDALVLSRRLTSSRVSWDAEDDDFWERFEFGLGRGRCGKGGFGNDGRRKRCCVGRWMEDPLPHRLQPLGLHHFRTHEPPSESHLIALPPPSPPRGAHHLACLRPPERSNPRKVIIWFFCLFALVRPFPEFEWAETLSASASDPTTSSNSSGRARNAVNHLSEHWRRVYCDGHTPAEVLGCLHPETRGNILSFERECDGDQELTAHNSRGRSHERAPRESAPIPFYLWFQNPPHPTFATPFERLLHPSAFSHKAMTMTMISTTVLRFFCAKREEDRGNYARNNHTGMGRAMVKRELGEVTHGLLVVKRTRSTLHTLIPRSQSVFTPAHRYLDTMILSSLRGMGSASVVYRYYLTLPKSSLDHRRGVPLASRLQKSHIWLRRSGPVDGWHLSGNQPASRKEEGREIRKTVGKFKLRPPNYGYGRDRGRHRGGVSLLNENEGAVTQPANALFDKSLWEQRGGDWEVHWRWVRQAGKRIME